MPFLLGMAVASQLQQARRLAEAGTKAGAGQGSAGAVPAASSDPAQAKDPTKVGMRAGRSKLGRDQHPRDLRSL